MCRFIYIFTIFNIFFLFFPLWGDRGGLRAETEEDKFQYLFLEGVSQQQKGNAAEAFDLFDQCRRLKPDNADVHYKMSMLLLNLKRLDEARKEMELASQLAPKNDYYLEMVAEFCIQEKEYDKAIAAYERIYENDHERGDVLERLIQLGGQTENYDKMIWALEKLEVLEGKSERLSMMKYRIYLEQKKDKEALDELQSLANKYFNDLDYKVLLGDYYLQHDRTDEAYATYKDVLSQEPDNVSAQTSMYRYYLAKEQLDSSYVAMEQLLSNTSVQNEGKLQLIGWAIGENKRQNKDSTEIINLFKTVLSKPQDNAYLTLVYGHYLESISMDKDSITPVFEQALALEPDNIDAAVKLISYAWDEKDFDRVIALSRPARQYHPEELAFYYYEGIANMQKEDRKASIDIFQRGISTINEDSSPAIVADFYAILGDLYYQEGMKREAYCAYDSCLQWQEDNIGCLNNYAYYLSIEGKELDKAEQMSYKTIKKEKENATYLDTYAWILFKTERYTEAKIYIDKALEFMDSTAVNTEIYTHAGDIYYYNNDREKAIEYWSQALKLTPDDKILQKKIRKYRKKK